MHAPPARRRSRLTRWSTALSILSLLASAPAYGQSEGDADMPQRMSRLKALSLEDLVELKVPTVVAASKHEQSASDAPASVSVVTHSDIQQRGYQTLRELLNGVRGFYTTFDRSYAFIGVRGFSTPSDFGGRVLLTVNGQRLNEPIYDQLFLDREFPLDLGLVERVEVIRGSGSSLYGNNAFFGVINVVTRDAGQFEHGEVSAEGGSFGTYSGRATFGHKWENGVGLLLSGTLGHSDGHSRLEFPEYAAVNNGIAENLDAVDWQQGFASFTYKGITLEALFGSRQKDVPTGPYFSVFNPPFNDLLDERGYVALRLEQPFGDRVTLSARAGYDHYYYSQRAVYDPGAVRNLDVALADTYGADFNLRAELFEGNWFSIGGEARMPVTIRQFNEDIDPANQNLSVTDDQRSFGVYLQDEWHIHPRLLLNAGVRLDYFDSFGETVNPRVAFVWTPLDDTTLKAIYGSAFRAPNGYERDFSGAFGYVKNPGIQPETVRSWEFIWEQFWAGKSLRSSVSAFRYDVADLITQEMDLLAGTTSFVNQGDVEGWGGEAELEYLGHGGWRAGISYTFSDVKNVTMSSRLENSPSHLGKAFVTVPVFTPKLQATLEVVGMSRRLTHSGAFTDGFAVANFTLLSRELAPGLTVSASVQNLFDTRYADPVSTDYLQDAIEQDGRSFRIQAVWKF